MDHTVAAFPSVTITGPPRYNTMRDSTDRGRRRGQGGELLGVLAHEPHAPRAQTGIERFRHAVRPLGVKQQRYQTRVDSVDEIGERG